ncbi:uncharacterized protein LOC126908981 [Daktulosphaira vitifoliae]|uniref:uncharacterized protein LOC126908981 n=1 Tax=Daktulosphaira vitifoliae TaxID=58002 RepID=UPI0021A9BD6B|nr:uncharacterized protein LOC126908981 [Daktulosphaira vitifoliae]
MWTNEGKNEERKKLTYVSIVLALYEISFSNSFAAGVRSTARSLLNRLTSYETTLTAMMFLQIFKFTTALSDYLQTSSLDYIQAWRKIEVTIKSLKENQREFSSISAAAKEFSIFTSEVIWKHETEIDIGLELPQKRRINIPRRFEDNPNIDPEIGASPEKIYEIKTFSVVMDTTIACLENRFSGSNDIKYKINTVQDKSDFEDYMQNENIEEKCTNIRKCNSCLLCVTNIIYEFNMYSLEYKELFDVYKFLLTIPLTQTTCERSFSKLKLIKTRLRSTLTQPNLESIFIMNCEREIVDEITNDEIIDSMCEKSLEMFRLLKI